VVLIAGFYCSITIATGSGKTVYKLVFCVLIFQHSYILNSLFSIQFRSLRRWQVHHLSVSLLQYKFGTSSTIKRPYIGILDLSEHSDRKCLTVKNSMPRSRTLKHILLYLEMFIVFRQR